MPLSHETMLVVSALLLGAPFVGHYLWRRLGTQVHVVTFPEPQSAIKSVYFTVRNDCVTDVRLLCEDGSADAHSDSPCGQGGME